MCTLNNEETFHVAVKENRHKKNRKSKRKFVDDFFLICSLFFDENVMKAGMETHQIVNHVAHAFLKILWYQTLVANTIPFVVNIL